MHKAGLKNDQIASNLGVSPGTRQGQITELISGGRLVSRRGLLWAQTDCYVEGRERAIEAVTDEVRELYRAGKTHEEMSAEMGLTENQIHDILSILFTDSLPKRARRRRLQL